MIRHLRISLSGRVYEVVVEDVTASLAQTSASTAAATTTMMPMPGPLVPLSKPEPVNVAPAAALSQPIVGGPDERTAPLAGIVHEINVKIGDVVALDDPLFVLEAMKMKTAVGAHKAGRVAAILVAEGDAVDADQPIVTIA
jgi:biotin carboxyl carrier protein